MKRITWIVSVCGAALLCGAATTCAAEPTTAPRAAGRVLSATVHWENVPLSEALQRLSAQFGATILLDRRVDSSQRVSLKIAEASLEEILRHLGEELSLDLFALGGVDYLGPRGIAARLELRRGALAQEIAALPGAQAEALRDTRALEWARLAEPRAVIVSHLDSLGWRVRNAAAIPHDLWDAGGLPPMATSDQLLLLLAGFDLTYRISLEARAIEIVLLDGATPDGGATPGDEAAPEKIAANRAASKSDRTRMKTTPQGAAPVARPGPAARAPGTKQVYTLRVAEQPVGAVLRGLAQRLAWRLEIDEASLETAGRTLEERVSFEVTNVDAEELLRELLKPAGLEFEMEGDRVRVFAGAQ